MKKQLHKIKIAAENFSRPAKPDKNSEELLQADRQVEKYKEVLDKICKKFLQNPSNSNYSSNANIDQDSVALEKRCKKVHEYKLAQAMEESVKELPDCLLRDVLDSCAKLEKNIAVEIVNNEINVENDVTKKLSIILDNHITTIQKQKRIVGKLMQDNESAKHKYQAAIRVNENASKINQLREEQEECETKLEKERDIWAAEMFELIAEEKNMASYIINYIQFQKLYYKSALDEIEEVMQRVQGLIKGNNRKLFKVSLEEHLAVTNRTISFVMELCVCCLLEKGMYEEGLLRVGCAGSKLRRLRSALDANLIGVPYPPEYQDVNVIACVLKSYLRDLPDPLLTFGLYDEFIAAVQQPSEDRRKASILNAINRLPRNHYSNLRYLTKFLELLSQKQKYNKMSPQNIAIVMSPNLLWAPESVESDYLEKVNSTAAVNTIVEAIVSDWSYFFPDEFALSDFYVTITRDELFPDNGGFSIDRDRDLVPPIDNVMTKSLNIGVGGLGGSSSVSHGDSNYRSLLSSDYQTHSRSSSHDTSLILLGSGMDDGSTAKRSQSNSSLSDSSPPQQNSPKLPVRRKHNKQVAPTPPDTRFSRSSEMHAAGGYSLARSMTESKERFFRGIHNDDDNQIAQSHGGSTFLARPPQQQASIKQRHGSTENLFAKPDKPPRPVMPSVESQTLIRNAFKAKALDKAGKPVALPRSLLNVARSTENLSTAGSVFHDHPSGMTSSELGVHYNDSGEEPEPVLLRESRSDNKPAIPERPSSLIRSSYRAPVFDKFDKFDKLDPPLTDQSGSGGVKKAQSFRMSGSPSNSQKGFVVSNGPGRSLTTLERTHIYNVDKQQVEIIDVSDANGSQGNNSNNGGKPQGNSGNNGNKPGLPKPASTTATIRQTTTAQTDELNRAKEDNKRSADDKSAKEEGKPRTLPNTTLEPPSSGTDCVPPQSPRGHDPKLIKRPQIPAPPPPKGPSAIETGQTIAPMATATPTNAQLSSNPKVVGTSGNPLAAGNIAVPSNSATLDNSTHQGNSSVPGSPANLGIAGDSTKL